VAEFDAKKVSPMDWGVIGGGALALVSLFLPWWGVQSSVEGLGGSASGSGWEVGFGAWFGSLLVVAAGALVLMRYLGRQLPAMPVGENTLVAALASLGALLILLRVFTFDSADLGVVEYGRKIGAWTGLLAALVAAGAAIKRFMDSGEKPAWDSSKMPGAATSRVETSGYVPPADDVYPAPPADAAIYPPPPPPVTAPEAGHDHDMNGHDHQH
jgi:hypothetical protein